METARALGAYYTPVKLAEPLCRWAVREAGDSILDPSCGEGSFLVHGVDRLLALGTEPRRLSDQIAGVELDPRALSRARGVLLSRHPGLRWSRLAQDDFFLFAEENMEQVSFDAVVGNPPFLRTQGRSLVAKHRALRVARACGALLSAAAGAWAPFVAAACGLVRPGGRLAMVVPREALFVNYTKPLFTMLERRFANVNLIALDEYLFEGALVKVAMLLCEGVGPGTLRLHEARNLANLDRLIEAAPVAVPAPSWVWSRIPEPYRPAVGRALESPALKPLTELGALSIGVVTGEKDFFLLSEKRCRELDLPGLYLVPTLSKPSYLTGSTFLPSDLAELDHAGEACRLLTVPADYEKGIAPLDAYLSRGAEQGFDQNYKCRTRKPWYSVRRVMDAPDAFLGYLVKRRPRFAANAAEACSTNNLHRLYLREPWKEHIGVLAAAAFNAATMLSVELLGRIAAGGVLKIEPGDACKIRMVDPEKLLAVPRAVDRAAAIDRALREGRDGDAFALADDLVRRAMRWKERDMAHVRRAQQELRDARLRKAE